MFLGFCRTKQAYLTVAICLLFALISLLISLGGINRGWIVVHLEESSYPFTTYISHTWHVEMIKYSDSSINQTDITQPLPGDLAGVGIAALVLTVLAFVTTSITLLVLFRRFNPLTPGSIPPQPGTGTA